MAGTAALRDFARALKSRDASMADAIGKVLAEERAKHRELVTRIVAIEKRAAPDDEAAAVFDLHDERARRRSGNAA